jgi:hypothetical protein
MDISSEKIDLTPTKLTFSGTSNKKDYAFELELFEEIKTD